jgi:peptidoglycan hydrolase CwlO-like protein
LVGLLKRENESFQAHLQHFQQQYNQEMQEMHEQVGLLRGEFDHPEPMRPLKGSSFLKSQQSPLERSLDYTNTRIGDLEAHIAKLNAELTAREAAFEEELK